MSEVTDSARSADKEMIKQNLAKYPLPAYNPGDVVLIEADAVNKRGKLPSSRTKAVLAVVREHRDFLYTVTLLTGPACIDLKVKVDKITSLTRAVETGKQSKAHLESSDQYKNVVKLHRVMVFQKSKVSRIRNRNVTEECLIARTITRQQQCGRGQLAISQQLEKYLVLSGLINILHAYLKGPPHGTILSDKNSRLSRKPVNRTRSWRHLCLGNGTLVRYRI